MKKTVLVLLALTSFAFAGGKHYDVTFGAPAVLGSTTLESGQYQLSFDGSKVTLVNSNTRKSVEATATVQTSEKKSAKRSFSPSVSTARIS